MANPQVVTPPAVEPVTLTEVKSQTRVDFTTDDALLTSLITVARERVEGFLGYRLVATVLDYYLSLNGFPASDFIELPGGRLISIASLKYTDADGVETTWDAANYFAATAREPGALVLAYGVTWPSVTLKPAEAIVVRYSVGQGAVSAGTGTIVSSGTTVTGTGTNFDPEVPVDSLIVANGTTRRVTARASDTALTVEAAWPSNLSGASFSVVTAIPMLIRQAILMTVDDLYKNRGGERAAPGERVATGIPEAAQGLLWPIRLVSV